MNAIAMKAKNTINNDRHQIAVYAQEVAQMKADKKAAKIAQQNAVVQAQAEKYMVVAMVIAIAVTLTGASFIGFGIGISTLVALINNK